MSPPPGTIGHDPAAKILKLTPAELTRLVGEGVIPRVGPDAYQPGAIIGAYIDHLRAEPARRERNLTQVEIAAHLDMSDRRLRELLAELHLDHKRHSLADIRVAYIRRLREEAAGRQADSDEADLPLERALLAREQREGQRIKNEVARGTFAPIDLLSDVLATASQAIVDRLDQIPGALRRACPDLPAAARDTVMNELASARNEWVRQTESLLADLLADTDQPVDDEPGPPDATSEEPADED